MHAGAYRRQPSLELLLDRVRGLSQAPNSRPQDLAVSRDEHLRHGNDLRKRKRHGLLLQRLQGSGFLRRRFDLAHRLLPLGNHVRLHG